MQSNSENSIKHLAHDLNSIFTKILNSVELLKRKINVNEEILSLLNSIEAGTYLASEIIDDSLIKDSSQNSTRKVSLNAIVNDIVKSFSLQQKDKIKFLIELEPNLNLVDGKYSDFYRVILNLISNSMEAISQNGNILVSTKNINGNTFNVELKVSDDGAGIDEIHMPHIFVEDFSTKSKDKISGIGLSVVKSIIEKNNGIISVNSTIGKGTVFTIQLPAFSNTKAENLDKTKKILIAEDESILRELLAELFQSYNFVVVTTQTGKNVLQLLEQEIFDLLIIDKKMPEVDGITCIKNIRTLKNNIPIILASGSSTNIDNGVNSLVQKIILKPYNFEEMLSAVNELIG